MSEQSPDHQRMAARIEAILVAKDSEGEWVYTQTEVRDFIAACVFLLGVPVTPEIEGALTKFLGQFEVDEDAPDDEVMKLIVDYFERVPLNPTMMKEFEEFGRGELRGDRDDFDEEEVTGRVADARRATGRSGEARAPQGEQPGGAATPTPKKGLT